MALTNIHMGISTGLGRDAITVRDDDGEYFIEVQRYVTHGHPSRARVSIVSDGPNQTESHVYYEECFIEQLKDTDFFNNLILGYKHFLTKQPYYQHTGPTNKQLMQHPSLKSAWDEYMVIKSLLGLK